MITLLQFFRLGEYDYIELETFSKFLLFHYIIFMLTFLKICSKLSTFYSNTVLKVLSFLFYNKGN
ncbi:hypothetical protein E3V49_10900 [Streptococcus pseudopneumoniae]|uniref:Uncharacterized protein n=1 Tax=Streptococcus pseudopneumoniae TaxID=257758 RepID=A0A3A4MSL6_9STRE|nr:hypothetical protein C5O69_10265 [Streptococcus pseudopneumoniae]RJP10986.1 hypothetical protein C5O71_03385 [Streptococcus pseudopneumoniae]RJP84404.1 hypothetical protein C5O68_01125 [Streptococcus pseudopneumoniae]TMR56362.1 hypothetical protein E3V49_10900 [Streptococcus pseudopneumoniae]TMR64273.1 hypothetical protein E3V88_10305 [Streptococcus pseudopneumoniae]